MIAAVLCGATAVGKSALALRLAEANGFEIISADSRQIYRGLRIGVNAPSPSERERVAHHLIDFLEPGQGFSPREFPGRVRAVLDSRPEARFLIVGGTGLYLKELLYPAAFDRGPTPETVRVQVEEKLRREGLESLHAELLRLDPEGAASVHAHDRYRIVKRWENLLITGEGYARFAERQNLDGRFAGVPLIWMDVDRESLYARIDARVRDMAAAGWPEEARALASRPGAADSPALSSLGYREMAEAASGARTLADAVRAVQKKTRNYAKRQITFFRHQLPCLTRWEARRLEQVLEACGWDWDRFLAHSAAPAAGEAGLSG